MPRHTAKRQFICHTTGQNKSSALRQEYTALKSIDALSEYVYELLNVSGIPFMRSDDNLLSYAHNPEYRAHTVSPTVGRYQDHPLSTDNRLPSYTITSPISTTSWFTFTPFICTAPSTRWYSSFIFCPSMRTASHAGANHSASLRTVYLRLCFFFLLTFIISCEDPVIRKHICL